MTRTCAVPPCVLDFSSWLHKEVKCDETGKQSIPQLAFSLFLCPSDRAFLACLFQ